MNIKKFLTTFLLAFIVSAVFAQQYGAISGSVVTADKKPAEYITIVLKGTVKGTITDKDGNFLITKITPGEYKLSASFVGLQTKIVPVTITAGNTLELQPIILSESNQQLDAIIVTDERLNEFADKESAYVARLPLTNIENPQVYTAITNELMEEQAVTDLESSLVNATGVSGIMQGIGSGGVGLNMVMRGFSTDVTMRNGMATNFRTTSDPANLERLEIIKGPSGTLFGSQLVSYGGLVNRVTKQPETEFKGTLAYNTGSNSLSRLTADINVPLNEQKTALFRLNAAKHNEHSFQDYGLKRSLFIAPTFKYIINQKLTVNLEAELYQNKAPSTYFSFSGYTPSSLEELNYNFENSYSSNTVQSSIKVFNVFAKATYKITDNLTSITNVSSGNSDNDAFYLFLRMYDANSAQREVMNIESQFITTQIQENLIHELDLGAVKNTLLIGYDYYTLSTPYRRSTIVYDSISADSPDQDINMNEYEVRLGTTDPFRIGTRDWVTSSFYVSDVFKVMDRVSLMASLRADHFEDKDASSGYKQWVFSPKLGLVYETVDDQISAFANYMDGFSNVAPDLNADPVVNFDPEHAIQKEIGIKSNALDGRLSATLSYYDIKVIDVVRWVNNDGTWSKIQDGERSSKGFELELIANPIEGLNIVTGYGLNNSEYTAGNESIVGNTPAAAPKHSVNFWASYKVSEGTVKGLGLGFGGNYASECFVNDANLIEIPAYTVLNGTVFYDVPQFRIGVKVNNLTNEKYWAGMSGTYVQPQKLRNTVVSLAYKF